MGHGGERVSSLRSSLDGVEYFMLQGKDYHVVKKRWGVLLLVCCILFMDMISFSFFSFINDLTSFYFNVEPYMVDLQSTMHLIGRMVTVVIMCLFGQWLSLKHITVVGSLLNTVAAMLITMGVSLKDFPLLMIGMFLSGAGTAVLLSSVQLNSVNWFPLNERGKANALAFSARRIAYLVTIVIATRATGVSYSGQELTRMSPNETLYIDQRFETTFTTVFGALAICSFIGCMLSGIYIAESPPCDDEVDEAAKQLFILDERTPIIPKKTPSYDLRKELREVKSLFANRSFLLIVAIYAFVAMERPLGTILVSSLVLREFPSLSDQFVGIMLFIGIILASVFSVIGGQVLDKFGKPRTTFVCIGSLTIVGLAVFSLSFHIRNVIAMFASFLLLWSTRDALLVCITHRLCGITGDQPDSIRVKAYSIPTAATSLFVTISTVVIRVLFENVNTAAAVLFPMPFLIISVLCYVLLWSYLRDSTSI